MIKEQLEKVREQMKREGINAYYINSSDYHQSEYVDDYFKIRAYLSGFTGSAGDLVVTERGAVLWTDGRYSVQIAKELQGSGIDFYVLGEKDYVDKKEWLKNKMSAGTVVGFDGKIVSAKFGKELEATLQEKGVKVKSDVDFINNIWTDRPAFPSTKAFILDDKYTGMSRVQKIENVRAEMKKNSVDYLVITTLDDIAWLLNLRGRDIKNTPVTLSYVLMSLDKCTLYIDENKIKGNVEEELKASNITVAQYNKIYGDVKNIDSKNKVWLNKDTINYTLYTEVSKCNLKEDLLPTTHMKSIKNSVELTNTKQAHLKDAVAVTKFTYWLKTNINKIEIDEISAGKKIEELRAEQTGYIEPSFTTISAYMSNAAMCHYAPKEDNFSKLKNEGLYLIDSGGQYFEGTTDITRTIALGKVADELKKHFTLVLKGMIAVATIKFPEGTKGNAIDILARRALWEEGLNYNHGTGHGIGHVLGVHEGPHGINSANNVHPLKVGMIVTDEPGMYVEGSHGIRIENEIYVKEYKETLYGKFLQFEPLTFVPIDLDAIDVSLLTVVERKYLNDYHKEVFNKVAPYLSSEEVAWLKEYTREI